MMTVTHTRRAIGALALTAALMAAPALAQPGGATPVSTQTVFASDLENLSEKFVGLARVMAGKYDWKPGEGVRSLGDVFNLIVNENHLLAALLTGAAPPARSNPITDAAQMQEALRSSYAALKEAVAGLPQNDLDTTIRMFGRDRTKQSAVLTMLFDQHEHLGQSIAYTRSNGIVPPWSK